MIEMSALVLLSKTAQFLIPEEMLTEHFISEVSQTVLYGIPPETKEDICAMIAEAWAVDRAGYIESLNCYIRHPNTPDLPGKPNVIVYELDTDVEECRVEIL